MIFGYPALFLHLLTILILGMVTGTMMASLLVRLVASRLPHYQLAIRRNLLWAFAVFPLFAGVAAALLSYLPEWKPQANLWLAWGILAFLPYWAAGLVCLEGLARGVRSSASATSRTAQ